MPAETGLCPVEGAGSSKLWGRSADADPEKGPERWMLQKDTKPKNIELGNTFEWLLIYLLHQGNCGLVEQDVEAGDEAKPSSKRCIERDDLRLWRRVKGHLRPVQVLFVVAGHQQAIGPVTKKRS